MGAKTSVAESYMAFHHRRCSVKERMRGEALPSPRNGGKDETVPSPNHQRHAGCSCSGSVCYIGLKYERGEDELWLPFPKGKGGRSSSLRGIDCVGPPSRQTARGRHSSTTGSSSLGWIWDRCGNDPSAGSPTETLLRLHLPLDVEI